MVNCIKIEVLLQNLSHFIVPSYISIVCGSITTYIPHVWEYGWRDINKLALLCSMSKYGEWITAAFSFPQLEKGRCTLFSKKYFTHDLWNWHLGFILWSGSTTLKLKSRCFNGWNDIFFMVGTTVYGGYNLPTPGWNRVKVAAKTWCGHVHMPTGAPDYA